MFGKYYYYREGLATKSRWQVVIMDVLTITIEVWVLEKRRLPRDEELNQRLLDANRRMENSSFRCVQVLNETVKMDVISHFPYSSPPSSVIEGLVL